MPVNFSKTTTTDTTGEAYASPPGPPRPPRGTHERISVTDTACTEASERDDPAAQRQLGEWVPADGRLVVAEKPVDAHERDRQNAHDDPEPSLKCGLPALDPRELPRGTAPLALPMGAGFRFGQPTNRRQRHRPGSGGCGPLWHPDADEGDRRADRGEGDVGDDRRHEHAQRDAALVVAIAERCEWDDRDRLSQCERGVEPQPPAAHVRRRGESENSVVTCARSCSARYSYPQRYAVA